MRFLLFPSTNSKFLSTIGLIFVIVGQVSRSLGMVTCGESFDHMIQKSKKNNHVLEGGEHYWFPCFQRVQQIVILWRVWFTPIPFDLQFCHLVRDNPSSYVDQVSTIGISVRGFSFSRLTLLSSQFFHGWQLANKKTCFSRFHQKQ